LGTAPLFAMPKFYAHFYAHFYAQRALFSPIVPPFSLCNPLIPRSGWL